MAVTLVFASVQIASAQPRRGNRNNDANKNSRPAITDKNLLKIHSAFVRDAQKLAENYEREKDWDKAITVYSEITRLVPQYAKAKDKLAQLRSIVANKEQHQTTVDARKGWQDSGVIVEEGKPIRIRAAGTWTFALSAKLSPDGIPIPKELREFDLGALIGYIDTGDAEKDKPFMVGSNHRFVAKSSGKLYFKMHDSNHKDNEGTINVEIVGDFRTRK